MNYSDTIAWKVKRCHWPLKAVEADGGVASGRAGRGGVMSASGMRRVGGEQRRLGPRRRGGTKRAEARRRRAWGFSFVFWRGRLWSGPGGAGREEEHMTSGGGGGGHKNQVAWRERGPAAERWEGCVTSAKALLTSESPDLSTAFNNWCNLCKRAIFIKQQVCAVRLCECVCGLLSYPRV